MSNDLKHVSTKPTVRDVLGGYTGKLAAHICSVLGNAPAYDARVLPVLQEFVTWYGVSGDVTPGSVKYMVGQQLWDYADQVAVAYAEVPTVNTKETTMSNKVKAASSSEVTIEGRSAVSSAQLDWVDTSEKYMPRSESEVLNLDNPDPTPVTTLKEGSTTVKSGVTTSESGESASEDSTSPSNSGVGTAPNLRDLVRLHTTGRGHDLLMLALSLSKKPEKDTVLQDLFKRFWIMWRSQRNVKTDWYRIYCDIEAYIVGHGGTLPPRSTSNNHLQRNAAGDPRLNDRDASGMISHKRDHDALTGASRRGRFSKQALAGMETIASTIIGVTTGGIIGGSISASTAAIIAVEDTVHRSRVQYNEAWLERYEKDTLPALKDRVAKIKAARKAISTNALVDGCNLDRGTSGKVKGTPKGTPKPVAKSVSKPVSKPVSKTKSKNVTTTDVVM